MITGRGAFPLHGGIISTQKRRFNRSLGVLANVPFINGNSSRVVMYNDWFFKSIPATARRLLGLLGVG